MSFKQSILYILSDPPTDSLTLPSKSGTYALILELKKEKIIIVGKLGEYKFESGYYIYFGSAFGPGGLRGRVNRHRKSIKKQHWHIDYLRKFCSLKEVWFSTNAMSLECSWSEAFSQICLVSSPVKGFGSSDCKCFTHLFYSEERPVISKTEKGGEKFFFDQFKAGLV